MVIIMLGAPGTGKGTIAGILTKELEIPQVSTGDIFRKHIGEQTELGKLAEKYISQGKLVPDDVTIGLVENRLEEDDVKEGIILDGFPRTVKQAEELDKILENKGKKVDLVINLTCGSRLIQRKDDNPETVKQRFNSYIEETSPLVDYYEKKGNLYSAVVSQSINKLGKDVAEDVLKFIKEGK